MKLKLIIFLGFVFNTAFSQLSTDKNYVYVKTYKNAVNEASTSTNDNDFNEVVTYVDGKGRTAQSVLIKAGGNLEDIVFNNEYDDLGRKSKEYLPYSKNVDNGSYVNNFASSQASFYNTAKYENTLNPYTQYVFDKDKIYSPVEISNAGNNWSLSNSKTLKKDWEVYNYGAITDVVREYFVTFDASNNPNLSYNDVYQPKTLFKRILKNENWVSADGVNNTTVIFEDLKGRTILKRVYNNNVEYDTYYVYDSQGTLYFVIPPKVEHLHLFDSSNNPTVNQNDVLNNLCFRYKYDYKNRITEKKIPGKGWEYFIYDKLNRVIMSQDANQRLTSPFKWNFVEYDIYGRVVYSGVLDDNSNNSRNQMQTIADGLTTTYVSYINTPDLYYTHYLSQFVLTVNTVNYYDNYQFNLDGITIPTTNFYGHAVNVLTKGLLTGTKNRTLGTNNWETLVYFYDKKERKIAVSSKNQTLSTVNTFDFKLDFSGKVIESKTNHSKTGVITNLTTTDNFSYDKNNRLTKHTQSIGYYPDELIGAYKYDELGKLEEKKVGGKVLLTLSGITNVNGLLLKTLSTDSWTNGSLYSQSGIVTKGKFTFKSAGSYTSSHLNIGLSYTASSTLYNQINYSFFLTSTLHANGGRVLNIQENGVTKFSTNYYPNDAFEIERMGSSIVYKKNGVLLYTSLTPATTATLYADGHFYANNTAITNLSIDNYDYASISSLQTLNYKYNIRGWLTQINDPNNLGNDLFGFEIRRNNPAITGTPLHNGNISQVFWKTANDNQLRYYDYSYDHIDRIKSAKFYNTSNTVQNGSFNLETVNYDKNGNITFLHRGGDKVSQPNLEWMDFMDYEYEGNQLKRVREQGHGYFGFTSTVLSTDTTPQFEYDSNGNLTKDRNKKIANITYNQFNLPVLITFETAGKSIEFTYDGLGKKLSKKVIDGANTVVTEYSDGYIYQKVNSGSTVLQYVFQPEGYVSYSGNMFNYVYQYTDHLGNIRLSYTDVNNNGAVATNEIIEESNYYPFGMKHSGYNSYFNILTGNSQAQNFKYNGKEYQDEIGLNTYDFGARNYDPALGRWMGIDKLSEKYNNGSTYAFALNNPIYYVDPDGNDPTPYEAALMASHVYDRKVDLVGGWKESTIYFARNPETGILANLYERRTKSGEMEYAFVYAGTEGLNKKDWKNNLKQALGASEQYDEAVKMATNVDKYLENYKVVFVGHSLGGGLATMSSLVTGRSSITFNPAWVSIATKVKYKNKLKPLKSNYRTSMVHESDPLNKIQEKHGWRIGLSREAVENEVEGGWFSNYLTGHLMDEMIERLEENGDNYQHEGDGDDDIVKPPKDKDDDDDDDEKRSNEKLDHHHGHPKYWDD